MNRYWLFQECEWEALGGLEDLKGTFKSIKKTKAYADDDDYGDVSYIIDSKTWKMLWRKYHGYAHKIDTEWKEVKENSYDIGEPKGGE